MKIIFMGTPSFAVPSLQKLLQSKHQIIAVYTQEPKKAGRGMKLFKQPIYQMAENNNLPIYTPKNFKSEEEQEIFLNLKADIAIVAAYGLILPRSILNATKYGCINIHPSLLPRWRGAVPIQHTILNGDKKTAVCIMKMDEGLDTGDIILKKEFLIEDDMTAVKLHDYCAELGAELLLESLERIENGNVSFTKQSAIGQTYAHKLTKNDFVVDWNASYIEIDRKIRALVPWPGVYTNFKEQKISIFEAKCYEQKHDYQPGTIIDKDLKIACKDGVIEPLLLQRAGRMKMYNSEFIKGFKFNIGDKFD